MNPTEFANLIASVTARIDGKPLDKTLEALLNREIPPGGEVWRRLADACRTAIADGWMCNREHAGIRYGRVVQPGSATHGFSTDVVDMSDIAGGHHRHPNGEIDMIMPVADDAKFDGHGAGWLVYEPGTAHTPTVAGGRALVLYLLPQGAIEFTKR